MDFFSGQKSFSLVNSYKSNWVSTDKGVPQGLIIAPILFILYIEDVTSVSTC